MRIHQAIPAVLLALGLGAAAPALHADTSVTIEKGHKHHYVYYGDHQIYYAPETKTYYWQDNGNWTSGTALPEADRAYVRSGGIELDLDTDRPYERHEWVLAHYKHHGDRDRDDDEHEHH